MSGKGKVPTGEDLIDPLNARGDPVYADMLESVAEDGYECPFCTMAVHPKPILHRVGEKASHHWFITERHKVPDGVKYYFLIIPGRHIADHRDMTGNDDRLVRALVQWVEENYNDIEGFGLLLRSGNSKITGATVRHLHYHLIVPEIDEETELAKPYYFPIG